MSDAERTLCLAHHRPSEPSPKAAPARAPSPFAFPTLPPYARDSFSSTAFFDLTDRAVDAMTGRFTFGLSPLALFDLYVEWASGLAFSPGKRAQLVDKAWRKGLRYASFVQRYMADPEGAELCIEPLPQDKRFRDEAWRDPPFVFYAQAFLLWQQWWHNATTDVKGLDAQMERAAQFTARQLADIYSPSNYIWTNPKILAATREQGGANLLRGFQNFIEDWNLAAAGRPPVGAEAFQVGRDVAATPGKVVYQNDLIELIQYEPATDTVHDEPILIVPAWIMKYYILDLSPHNSLVRFLVERGFTVFMISWKNPDTNDRDKGMETYLRLGPEAALEAIARIVPERKVHAIGYCLGGTLLAIEAAARARGAADPFQSLSFFAAQVDFEEAGELMLFINEQQLSFLENMMWEQGFLDTRQMAGTFQLLRSNDLIWSRLQNDYLMGERRAMTDMMAWNADATRMPYRMHSEYLRSLFLNNDLSEGRYRVEGRPIAISDIRAPIFSVGAQKDHVAPWRSVFKVHLLADTEITFVLASGGHNVGIVSEPGTRYGSYQAATSKVGEPYAGPDLWAERTPVQDGSWWPAFADWLAERSTGLSPPPPLGEAGAEQLHDAPGRYVLQT